MTEDKTPDDKLTYRRDSEFDIPSSYGGITMWEHLVEEFEESLIGLGREVFPETEDGTWHEYRYRYAVAEKFLETEGETKLDGMQGYRSANQCRLTKAMEAVAETEGVTQEHIRKASVQPYEPSEQKKMKQQFLVDLYELEGRLNAWSEQDQE